MSARAVLLVVVAAAAAFLLGSLPWALWVGRWARGVDVRQHGSGNLGATNVYRTLGPALGWTVFALDLLKGTAAVGLAGALAGDALPGGADTARAGGALCAVLGHAFTPFARFRGGKGVATGLGAMLAIAPWATLVCFGVFTLALVLSRRISVGSITAALALPALLWAAPFARAGTATAIVGTALAGFVVARHVPNMKRLLRGAEPPFSFRPPAAGGRP